MLKFFIYLVLRTDINKARKFFRYDVFSARPNSNGPNRVKDKTQFKWTKQSEG